MAGRKRRAAKAGLTMGAVKRKEALDDLKSSVKLLGRSIDGVLNGVPDCHVGLIEHGMALMLGRRATACQTPNVATLRRRVPIFKPGAGATPERGGGAVSVEGGAMKTEPPSVKSYKQQCAARGAGRAAPRRGPAAASTASPSWPPSSESSWQEAVTDDDAASSELSEEEEETSAQTSCPSSSPAALSVSPAAGSPRSSPTHTTPPPIQSAFNVFLEWYAAGPGTIAGQAVESLRTPAGGLRDSFNLDVPSFFQVWDKNSDKGSSGAAGGAEEPEAVTAARRADLVVWHLTSRTLELPVDEKFSTASVTDALGREFALNFAMVTLLEAANDRCYPRRTGDGEHEVRSPAYGDDPDDVADFFARFEANVQALMEEARSAPAAFSTPPPNFSRSVEDGLRTALVSVRRRHRKLEEIHPFSLKEDVADADAPAVPSAMLHRPARDDELRSRGPPSTVDPWGDATSTPGSSTLVLRPMEDLFRVFSEVELMVAFEKTTGGKMPRGCYEMWFERKRIVRTGGVVFRHEYVMRTGHWYGSSNESARWGRSS